MSRLKCHLLTSISCTILLCGFIFGTPEMCIDGTFPEIAVQEKVSSVVLFEPPNSSHESDLYPNIATSGELSQFKPNHVQAVPSTIENEQDTYYTGYNNVPLYIIAAEIILDAIQSSLIPKYPETQNSRSSNAQNSQKTITSGLDVGTEAAATRELSLEASSSQKQGQDADQSQAAEGSKMDRIECSNSQDSCTEYSGISTRSPSSLQRSKSSRLSGLRDLPQTPNNLASMTPRHLRFETLVGDSTAQGFWLHREHSYPFTSDHERPATDPYYSDAKSPSARSGSMPDGVTIIQMLEGVNSNQTPEPKSKSCGDGKSVQE
jgi:hypothetical protein